MRQAPRCGGLGLLALMLLAAIAGPGSARGSDIVETIELPPALRQGELSLEETLAARRSVRRFAPLRSLSLDQIGQLFWSAQGLSDGDRRTAPSAGALYPIEIYAVTRKAVYHYRPGDHSAVASWRGGMLDSLWVAAHSNKEAIRRAPAVFVITGTIARTEAKYGERARRYATLEAGHAAQNLLLQAVALGLGAVPIGSFRDGQVSQVLGLSGGETPFYLIPVGYPEKEP